MSNSIPKTIICADIHGMLDRLKNLFGKIEINKYDTVIFLGDYVDRGPDSMGVIDFIISLKDKCNLITLLGNHESMAMESFKYMEGKPYNKSYIDSWGSNGGKKCLESYDIQAVSEGYNQAAIAKMMKLHGDFFNNLQLTHEDENFIYVHGYLSANVDVADQEEFLCIWGRFEDIKPHKSGKTVICGHTPHKEPVNMGYKICLDTASFKSDGCITAMVIEGNKQVFVNSN